MVRIASIWYQIPYMCIVWSVTLILVWIMRVFINLPAEGLSTNEASGHLQAQCGMKSELQVQSFAGYQWFRITYIDPMTPLTHCDLVMPYDVI